MIAAVLASLAMTAEAPKVPQRPSKAERHERRWKEIVRESGQRDYLLSIARCETGPPYNSWRFHNNGNGFFFRHQYTPSTWRSVGGRFRYGVPRGRFGHRVPAKPEQMFRALRVLRSQGPGAWPNCA